MSSASGVKLELTTPIEALSTKPKSMFAVPSKYKFFHCKALVPKLQISSTSGVRLELTLPIEALSNVANPLTVKSSSITASSLE